jgi:hypothetical protein
MIRVIYKHWKTGDVLEVVGTMPQELNKATNDRLVILKEDGQFEDVIKETVIRVESL